MSYWGQSYGTYLGAVYTTLFPRHSDRLVFEGNVDPNRVWAQQIRTWNKGMDARFPDAARVAVNAGLGLGGTVEEVEKTFVDVADKLDRQPVPVPGTPVSLNGGLLRAVTYQLLMHDDTLAPLTRSWRAAADLAAGNAPDLAVLSQVFAGSPAEPGVPADNQITMSLAILCGDATWSHDVASYETNTAADRERYPLSAGMPANIWPCAFWSRTPVEAAVTVTAKGPRDVLILQNRRDNATPWESGLGMRRALGGRAGFVGVDNGGHYVYGTGSTCADEAAVAFLTAGTLPAKDISC
ncbi:alpha/beta hydrolase [Actinophytocola sp.]|uniref:alpha/beta hydrolase n=1 Tax=Actinophytocola sp. TaxID=1872138 RepID=UPI002D6E6CB6|nr:alpha/beta hydrolase [Actinophytocola sp.]HYQ69471.1 alpha/beta hydrolase [Actinophytocola sp.]